MLDCTYAENAIREQMPCDSQASCQLRVLTCRKSKERVAAVLSKNETSNNDVVGPAVATSIAVRVAVSRDCKTASGRGSNR